MRICAYLWAAHLRQTVLCVPRILWEYSCSPTDFTLHRWLGCVGFPTESTDLTELLAVKRLPRNPRNSRKFIAEKKLPQIAQIHTDVTSGGAAVSAAPTKPDGTIILTVGVSQNLINADSASL